MVSQSMMWRLADVISQLEQQAQLDEEIGHGIHDAKDRKKLEGALLRLHELQQDAVDGWGEIMAFNEREAKEKAVKQVLKDAEN
jgi:hypothetical protein